MNPADFLHGCGVDTADPEVQAEIAKAEANAQRDRAEDWHKVADDRAREITRLNEELAKPIDMLLFCPNCTEQHIDAPHGDWTNPPHRTHECQRCNVQWRPCDRPTNGVAGLKTKGKYDSPAQPRPYPPGFGG